MVKKILYDLNCYKFFKFNVEPCAETLFYVYIWFYNWPDKTPENLADHLEDIVVKTNKKLKQYFNNLEITKLTEMRNNKSKLKSFDITFYYKLIQFGTNSDTIQPPSNSVWNNNCPPNLQHEMEYLLFQLKQDRNKISHKDESILNLTDNDLSIIYQTLLKRLPSIIQQAGKRNNVDQAEIDGVCDNLVKQIRDIYGQITISQIDRTAVLNYIREQDLEGRYLSKLKLSFDEELEGYSSLKFLRHSDEIKFKTKQLLAVTDTQVIIIDGETGSGKTSLTKFLFYQWLLKNTTKVIGLSSFDIVFRIPCRNITTRDISEFLENEIPTAFQNMPATSSKKKIIDSFKVLWILDGYDESTAEFPGFLKSLLQNFQEDHKIILTSRKISLTEIDDIFNYKNLSISKVSIRNFIEKQVYKVARKILKDEARANEFVSFYLSLDLQSREFLGTPINLHLCLGLWTKDPLSLQGNLMTNNLYTMSFEVQVKNLYDRHEDRTHIRKNNHLKNRVQHWFDDSLCNVAVESIFKHKMFINKADEFDLCDSALNLGLNEQYCISTFLESEISPIGSLCYFFQHKVQMEVLGSLYLKRCDEQKLRKIINQCEPQLFMQNMDHLKFLYKCCDSLQFSEIFGVFLKTLKSLQRPAYLLEIKASNEQFFKSLKTKIISWEELLELQLRCHRCESQNLNEVIENMSPDVNCFKLVLLIQHKSPMFFYETINKVLTDLKKSKSIAVVLDSTVEKKLVDIYQMFEKEGNHKLIKELIFRYTFWQKEAVKEVFSTQNFEKDQFSFFTDCAPYSPILLCLSSCSSASFLLNMGIHAHFDLIYCGDSPGEILFDLLKVSQKFSYVTVDLDITNYGVPKTAVQDDWMSEFQSSMKIKKLKMKFQDIETDNIYLQITNCVNTGSLEMSLLTIENNLTLEQDLEKFFDIWKFSSLTKLDEIKFEIFLDQLIVLYDKIPQNLASKTNVTVVDEQSIIFFFKVINPDKKRNNILDSSSIPVPSVKRFKKIRIPNELPVEDTETIESLKEITETCDFYYCR